MAVRYRWLVFVLFASRALVVQSSGSGWSSPLPYPPTPPHLQDDHQYPQQQQRQQQEHSSQPSPQLRQPPGAPGTRYGAPPAQLSPAEFNVHRRENQYSKPAINGISTDDTSVPQKDLSSNLENEGSLQNGKIRDLGFERAGNEIDRNSLSTSAQAGVALLQGQRQLDHGSQPAAVSNIGRQATSQQQGMSYNFQPQQPYQESPSSLGSKNFDISTISAMPQAQQQIPMRSQQSSMIGGRRSFASIHGQFPQQQQPQRWGNADAMNAWNQDAQIANFLSRFAPGEVDKATARRFLTARQWDMTKSTQLLKDHLQWKRAFNCPVDPKSCLGELIKGKTFLHGQDLVGNALVYHFCRKQDPSERDLQETIRSVVFWAEQCEKPEFSKTGKITLVFVRSGISGRNADPKLAQAIAPILQNNFPERLDKILVYPRDISFNAMWFAAQFWLDSNTRMKVTPISHQYELFSYISPENLLAEFGGFDQFQFDPAKDIPGINWWDLDAHQAKKFQQQNQQQQQQQQQQMLHQHHIAVQQRQPHPPMSRQQNVRAFPSFDRYGQGKFAPTVPFNAPQHSLSVQQQQQQQQQQHAVGGRGPFGGGVGSRLSGLGNALFRGNNNNNLGYSQQAPPLQNMRQGAPWGSAPGNPKVQPSADRGYSNFNSRGYSQSNDIQQGYGMPHSNNRIVQGHPPVDFRDSSPQSHPRGRENQRRPYDASMPPEGVRGGPPMTPPQRFQQPPPPPPFSPQPQPLQPDQGLSNPSLKQQPQVRGIGSSSVPHAQFQEHLSLPQQDGPPQSH